MEIVCGSGQQYYVVNAAQIQASMKWEDSGLEAELQGKATIQRIQLKDLSFAQNIPLSRGCYEYELQQNLDPEAYSVQPWKVSTYCTRKLGPRSCVFMAFTVQGKKISPQPYCAVCPSSTTNKLSHMICVVS